MVEQTMAVLNKTMMIAKIEKNPVCKSDLDSKMDCRLFGQTNDIGILEDGQSAGICRNLRKPKVRKPHGIHNGGLAIPGIKVSFFS